MGYPERSGCATFGFAEYVAQHLVAGSFERCVERNAFRTEGEYPISQRAHQPQVMHHSDERETALGSEPCKQFDHLYRSFRVEACRGLVGKHDVCPLVQRPGNGHALPLASRKPVRALFSETMHAHRKERFPSAGALVRWKEPGPACELRATASAGETAEQNIFDDRQARNEMCALQHLANFGAQLTQSSGRNALIEGAPEHR